MASKSSKHNTVKASQVFGDYIIMLIAPAILSVMYYGARAAAVIAVSVLSAVISDFAANFLLKRSFLLRDLSNIFIGAAIAMMMPAGIPLYVPVIASAAGVLTAKIPFGSSLRAPFVPAAAGFAIVSVCFKEEVFTYTHNIEDKLFGAKSLASLLAQGSPIRIHISNVFEVISGNISGPMGTGCGILMVVCCCYLFVRRRSSLLATAGFIGACVIFAMVSPRVSASPLISVVLELSAGSLLFGAVFLVTDPATLPKGGAVKLIYGAVCGVICMFMRKFGTYEETVCFAVLMANGFSPVIESAIKNLPSFSKSKKKEAAEK